MTSFINTVWRENKLDTGEDRKSQRMRRKQKIRSEALLNQSSRKIRSGLTIVRAEKEILWAQPNPCIPTAWVWLSSNLLSEEMKSNIYIYNIRIHFCFNPRCGI